MWTENICKNSVFKFLRRRGVDEALSLLLNGLGKTTTSVWLEHLRMFFFFFRTRENQTAKTASNFRLVLRRQLREYCNFK